MRDATPNPKHNGPTRYAVVLLHEDQRTPVVIGYTPRTSRIGVMNLVQSRGEEILEHIDIPEDSQAEFHKVGGRWVLDFTKSPWSVAVTQNTERTMATLISQGDTILAQGVA